MQIRRKRDMIYDMEELSEYETKKISNRSHMMPIGVKDCLLLIDEEINIVKKSILELDSLFDKMVKNFIEEDGSNFLFERCFANTLWKIQNPDKLFYFVREISEIDPSLGVLIGKTNLSLGAYNYKMECIYGNYKN